MFIQIGANLQKNSNIFIEKDSYVSGPIQFKSMFKGQLYAVWFHLCEALEKTNIN